MIIMFKYGKLANAFETLREANEKTRLSTDNISELILSGEQSSQGYSFDYGLDNINYEGWGCEDERNLVI
jgi:hypothetical protein